MVGLFCPPPCAYMFAVHYVVGKRVLDAGTGYGYGAAVLAASGASSVLAVDIDQELSQRLRLPIRLITYTSRSPTARSWMIFPLGSISCAISRISNI